MVLRTVITFHVLWLALLLMIFRKIIFELMLYRDGELDSVNTLKMEKNTPPILKYKISLMAYALNAFYPHSHKSNSQAILSLEVFLPT